MESEERFRITANLDKLIEDTLCTDQFLAHFEAAGHLCRSDTETLKCITENIARARRFYLIILTRKDAFKCLLTALHYTRQSGALQLLRHGSIPNSIPQPKKLSTLPNSTSLFHGRKAELRKLHKLVTHKEYNSADLIDSSELITLVYGTAGIGKTELCLHYIHSVFIAESENVVILYFNLRNESTLPESIADMTSTIFEYNHNECSIPFIMQRLFNYIINEQVKCVLLLDNCNDIESLQNVVLNCTIRQIKEFVFLKILIITQVSNLDSSISNRFHLKEMSDQDACSFAKKYLESLNFSDFSIEKLVKTLDNHPLAILNAVNFVKERNSTGRYSIDNYLDFIENSSSALEYECKQLGGHYPLPISSIWNSALDRVKDDKDIGHIAQRILYYLAYIGHPNLVLATSGFNVPAATIKAVRKLLMRNCLIDLNDGDNTLKMSNGLSMVLREKAKAEGQEVNVLSEILECISISKHMPSELFYCAWRYACRYKQFCHKYCFSAAGVNEHNESPLHMFVERDDKNAVSFLLKHFPMCKWNNSNVVEYWLTSSRYSTLAIKNRQTEILVEFRKAGYELAWCGDDHVIVDLTAASYHRLYYNLFIGVILLAYSVSILMLSVFHFEE